MTNTTKLNWEKCPSATSGGKAYFYHARRVNFNSGCWVIWSRERKAWIAKTDCWTSLLTFSTPKKAQNWVETNNNQHCEQCGQSYN